MMKNKIKVAVYGSLRKGLHNHSYLKNAKYIGSYYSLPEYTLYSLGSYPGLKLNGSTSVMFEVYEVTQDEAKDIDSLEGVDYELYVKQSVTTPYGKCCLYIYNKNVDNKEVVKHGNWFEYAKVNVQ